MSYCVNCGVELSDTEKKCPLCDTEVINPAKKEEIIAQRRYSDSIERVVSRIDRKYLASLCSVIMLIPIFVCLLCDLLNGTLSWSGYVTGALVTVFVIVLFPLFFKRPRYYLFLFADTVVLSLFLFFINYSVGGQWFISLALPLILSLAALIALQILWYTCRRRRHLAITFAITFLSIGLYSVCVNILVLSYLMLPPIPSWSLYSFIPCAVMSVFFMVLNKRNDWKEGIRKKLFL